MTRPDTHVKSRWTLDRMLEISNLNLAVLVVVIGVNVLLSIAANASFRMSATSQTRQSFLTWQVAGNLAGLGTVLTLRPCGAFCRCTWLSRSPLVWQSSACRLLLASCCSTK